MKTNSRVMLVVALVSGVVVLALCIVLLLVMRRPTSKELPAIVPPSLNPILITITSPAEGGVFPINGSVPVLVKLDSEQPLQGIRFWLDGDEIGTVLPDSPEISARFYFPSARLKGEEWHTLYAGAVDQTGRVTLSNAVHLKGSPSVGMETIYVTEAGDTLDSIAAAFQADPDKLQARNSGWSGGGGDPLPVGAAVIIPFDPPATPPQADPTPPEGNYPFSSSLPKPPSIELQAEQCAVTVTLQDLASDADGFVLYRLDAQESQFAPIASFEGSQKSPLAYQDATASGTVLYVASAYTDQGEDLGNPAEIALTAPGCANPSTLIVSGNFLTLPPSSNGTYFYWATEGNGYERYPASSVEFLTLEDGTFDLRSLPNLPEAGGIQAGVALEAWRWDAGQLSLLGSAQARIQTDAELLICPTGTICGGDGGIPYSQSAVVGSDQEDQLRKFKWRVVSPLASNYGSALFQLSLQPFLMGVEENPPGLAYSKVLSGKMISADIVEGAFNLDFKNLGETFARTEGVAEILVNQSESPNSSDPWLLNHYEKNPDVSDNIFQLFPDADLNAGFLTLPLTYYARIIPLSGGKLVQSASNVVTIQNTPTDADGITVIPETSSIYEIDIIGSAAPIPPTAHWGCVDIIAVNPNSWVWTTPGMFNGQLANFESMLKNHQPYCPPPYKQEEKAWYEDLWDFVNEGLKAIDAIYQAAKQLSVDSMLAQYKFLELDQLCPACAVQVEDALKKGQEWVLQYQYGLPAEIPDLDKLSEDGIDLLADEALKYVGLDPENCPPGIDCKKLLTDALLKLKEEFLNQSVANYQNDAIAHSQGYYALLMPVDPTAITVMPAKTSNWQMAEATVRVTRAADATSLTDQQLSHLNLTLNVDVFAVNDTCRNLTYRYCVNQGTVNGAPGQCAEQLVVLGDEPCEGELFSGFKRLPLLAPGESKEFIIKLTPRPYWSPAMPAEYKVYNPAGDFDLLYYGAQAEISARIPSNAFMTEASDGPDPFVLTDLHP